MTSKTLMKDGIGKPAIARISNALKQNLPEFNEKKFQQLALNGLDQLELKQRVYHLINVLHFYLPSNFKKTAKILQNISVSWDGGNENDPLAEFAAWPFIDYVGQYGLNHPKEALITLEKLTPLFSAEFAIRPFIKQHYELTFEFLKKCTQNDDAHVRRLASEGTRPRLPWGEQLPQFISDPSPVIELLEDLRRDNSEYVRRSVANNLNDISKDNPATVIKTCKRWKSENSPEILWIIRHATRSLVKSGHPEVFSLLGHTINPEISIRKIKLDKTSLNIGDKLSFSFTINSNSQKTQKFELDYAVHFMKANGKPSAKVFKLKKMTLSNKQAVDISKSHSFKPITTRKYYPGEHAIELLVNGKSYGLFKFNLTSV